jgi:hypothetical protein
MVAESRCRSAPFGLVILDRVEGGTGATSTSALYDHHGDLYDGCTRPRELWVALRDECRSQGRAPKLHKGELLGGF